MAEKVHCLYSIFFHTWNLMKFIYTILLGSFLLTIVTVTNLGKFDNSNPTEPKHERNLPASPDHPINYFHIASQPKTLSPDLNDERTAFEQLSWQWVSQEQSNARDEDILVYSAFFDVNYG
jgi:hypothetical protein